MCQQSSTCVELGGGIQIQNTGFKLGENNGNPALVSNMLTDYFTILQNHKVSLTEAGKFHSLEIVT